MIFRDANVAASVESLPAGAAISLSAYEIYRMQKL